MKPKEIRVVILTSRGPRHSYFCRRLADPFALKGIVVDHRYQFSDRLWTFLKGHGFHPLKMIKSFWLKKRLAPYEERDRQIEERFFPQAQTSAEFPPGIPVYWSRDPNSSETAEWIKNLSPDVITVFGTRLIRDPLLSLARLGALNLHTGLSPYYRGGQSTFWCLYEGDIEHLGVTVHHLSQQIDGGDIVFTARPELEAEDTVRSIECKLARLGTEGMIQAILDLAENKSVRTPQREKGKLFLSRMFTLEKRLALEEKLEKGWLGELLNQRSGSRTAPA